MGSGASPRINSNTIIWGFIAGALSVLVFHQLTIAALSGFNFGGVWRMAATVKPFAVPVLINQMFWGGLWGIVFAAISPVLPRGAACLVCGFLFGAIILAFSGWYLVPFVKSLFGQNLPYGPRAGSWWRGAVINGIWGLGTAVFLQLLPGPRR